MEKNFEIKRIKKKNGNVKKEGCSKKEIILKSKKGQTVEPLKREDIKRIFNFFEKENNIKIFAIIKIAINTGLRISDVLLLTFEEVESGRIKEKKTRKYKKIKFNDFCLEAIEKLKKFYKNNKIKNYNKGYLFKSSSDLEKPVSYQTFSYHIKRVREKLNIKYPFHSHSFRKTWAKEVYKKTKDIVMVMKALNHTNPAVTLRYVGIELEEIQELYDDIGF